MLTLYTAVGTLKFQKTTGGKSIPLVINDVQETPENQMEVCGLRI